MGNLFAMPARFLSPLFILILASGCFVETIDERSVTPGSGGGKNSDVKKNPLQLTGCRTTLRTGCFVGHIPAAPEIFVDGQSFMDVNDLANRFHELITVEGADGELRAGEGYELSLQSPLDNRSFAKGFEIYVKGGDSKNAKALANGQFVLNELLPGDYEIRVQKQLRFKIDRVELVPVEPEPGEGEPAESDSKEYREEVVEKQLCATLFADTYVEVRPGEQARFVFDDFRLYRSDHECAKSGANGTLTL